jgi:hypothetical protein
MIYLKPDKDGRPRELSRQEQERLAYKRRLWFVKRKYDNFIGMDNIRYTYSRNQAKRLSTREKFWLTIVGAQ